MAIGKRIESAMIRAGKKPGRHRQAPEDHRIGGVAVVRQGHRGRKSVRLSELAFVPRHHGRLPDHRARVGVARPVVAFGWAWRRRWRSAAGRPDPRGLCLGGGAGPEGAWGVVGRCHRLDPSRPAAGRRARRLRLLRWWANRCSRPTSRANLLLVKPGRTAPMPATTGLLIQEAFRRPRAMR